MLELRCLVENVQPSIFAGCKHSYFKVTVVTPTFAMTWTLPKCLALLPIILAI